MREITATYLDKMIGLQIVGTNHEVYDERYLNNVNYFDKVPHVIYFYYIKFGGDGCPKVYHYTYDNGAKSIPYNDVETHIKRLAENARGPLMQQIPQSDGQDFQGIIWRRKSYIAIFMDSPCWKLWKRSNNKCGILFNLLKGSTPNHSFFDAKDIEVDMSAAGDGSEMRSAVYFINHMKKNSRGEDIRYEIDGVTPDKQYFAFDVYFDVSNIGGASSTVFIIDPDGTNMGPPLSPP